MIAHVPGHLCVAELAEAMKVDRRVVYRMAHRHGWRTAKRPGHREVYYHFDDVLDTLNRNGA